MLLKPELKSSKDIPKTEGCICPLCGYENGYNKDRLFRLTTQKYIKYSTGKPVWLIEVGFICKKCNTPTEFRLETKTNPTKWQTAINLYGTL